ncbi:hypothetical protein M8J77_004714 [Diaphorina citri]|nr:hypothetical protein M8J77_004714 [Diaphorina citri]
MYEEVQSKEIQVHRTEECRLFENNKQYPKQQKQLESQNDTSDNVLVINHNLHPHMNKENVENKQLDKL